MPHRLLNEDGEQITPFSNHTDFAYWRSVNCDQCRKYEHESILIELAGCPLAFCLDVGTITGWVSRRVLDRIGVPEGVDRINVDCKERILTNQQLPGNSICYILNKKKEPENLGLFENLD